MTDEQAVIEHGTFVVEAGNRGTERIDPPAGEKYAFDRQLVSPHRCIRCGHPVRSHRYMNPRCVPACPCPGPVCILCDCGDSRCVDFTDPEAAP